MSNVRHVSIGVCERERLSCNDIGMCMSPLFVCVTERDVYILRVLACSQRSTSLSFE